MIAPKSTRRQFLKTGLGCALAVATGTAGLAKEKTRVAPAADILRPTPSQLAWQQAELSMFIHFGVNTFTDREWGAGNEEPGLFNPTRLDARQWVDVAREAGFRYVILTCKHHDGFCLWPSKYTEHSVKNSPWRGGKGDVIREFVDACREAKLKVGFYLSPWDRNCPAYGDSPAYNRYYKDQLAELLTGYGEVAEVWFDGACDEGPNGRKQEYDWHGYYEVIRKLQPDALIAISGPDIRWVGNEDGVARETEWCVQQSNPVFHGPPDRQVWWPAETDTSIRPGWFWHQSEDSQVKTLDHLLDIYYKSVGRNSVLLLNVPPNNLGLFADPDVARLREWRAALDRTFRVDLTRGARVTAGSSQPGAGAACAVDGKRDTYWSPQDGTLPASLELDLSELITFNVVSLQEHIAEGQRVEAYAVEAWTGQEWRHVAKGTTVGHRKLDRFPTISATKVRLTITRAAATPMIQSLGLYRSQG